MNRACEEAEGMELYDYLIVNDDLDACVEEMHSIIQRRAPQNKFRNADFMEKIKQDLINLKGED